MDISNIFLLANPNTGCLIDIESKIKFNYSK